MRCKKHPADHSGAVGVCATCLRERLISIIEAQAREEPSPARKPGPLIFPRSVSPYLSHRKSDTSAATWRNDHQKRQRHRIRSYHSLPDPKFFSTPQIGPTGGLISDQNQKNLKKKKTGKFGIFSKLFGSKSDKSSSESDPRVSAKTEAATPLWLPNFLSRKKTFSVDESAIRRLRRDHRGLSPEVYSDEEMESEISGYDSDEWRRTPRRTPANSRWRHGGGGISFCLSPMVRASPAQSWSYKGGGGAVPPEMVVSGEIRMPRTASFCKSRSRKMVDIGKSNHNR